MIGAEAQNILLLLSQHELIPYEQWDQQNAEVMTTSAWDYEAVPKEHKMVLLPEHVITQAQECSY